MADEANTILLTLHHCGESYRLQTNPAKYQSLMTLISDTLAIPGFGLCCGMGSCATCVVQIKNKRGYIRSVMACDISINDELANVDVIIPDEVY